MVLVDGDLTLYMERGGKTLLAWPASQDADAAPGDDPRLQIAAEALATAARAGALGTVTVERVNGAAALTSPSAPCSNLRASSRPPGGCACVPDTLQDPSEPLPAPGRFRSPRPCHP